MAAAVCWARARGGAGRSGLGTRHALLAERWVCASLGQRGGRLQEGGVPQGDGATVAGAGLHGDGFAEFQGGFYELLQLAAEVRQFPGDFGVAALEGLQPVEFRLELVDLL